MIRFIAAAALTAAAFTMPTVPAQADTLKDYIESCWFMPFAKDECAPTAPEAAAPAAAAPAVVAASAEEAADTFEWPTMMWGTCAPAPEGSKFLFVCE